MERGEEDVEDEWRRDDRVRYYTAQYRTVSPLTIMRHADSLFQKADHLLL